MKEYIIFAFLVIAAFFFIGLYMGQEITHEKLEDQAQQYERKLASKGLQLTLIQTTLKERERIIDKIITELDYISPRPITVK